ncbi:hypothetical protein TELCIR_06848 [Teladorsagia circumcincta]|uniref:PLAT domain-containing protein n=1 Tax=Teladorsagia circumcincta TaxID=45464 RepID=A0A2G9ULX3_TELCI|nr:hypothetical protein TELCIR_06848 [Teladorsagia circumcincta]
MLFFTEEAPQVKSETPRLDTPLPKRPERMTYTISVTTGNRWSAETEADLYIQMFGDEMTSRRFYLQQEVDGKIERTLPVSAFYYLNSVPDESMTSQGRWEFILHNGMEDGTGGTTSNLNIIGYGTTGSSMMHVNNDKTMSTVPDTTLIQVDFGAIGDLLKVRFEADGAGEEPDYFLEWIELRDLDTEERIAVRIGKWMDVTGKRTKKPQAFREISIFRSGDQPLETQNYEGKVQGGDMSLLESGRLQAQLVGDFSDSGVFPLIYSEKKQILAVSAFVRESTHCPYRYLLKESKIRELDENKNYFKVLRFTDMEGLSTKNKKHKFNAETSDWLLEMSVMGKPEITPEVCICSGHDFYPMKFLPDESADEQYTYEIRGSSLDSLQKLRVGVGEVDDNERFYIKKMRLVNQTTKTVLRFPNVDTEFESNQVYEFSPVYPDVQPALNILYSISLATIASTGLFRAVINVIGEDGDSGMRTFYDNVPYAEGSKHNFDADAVNLGPLQDVEVLIEGDENSSWSVNITVGITDNGMQYVTDLANIPAPGQVVRLPLHQR